MDLTYTPDEDAFRDEVRAWLRENVPDPRLPRADDREGFEVHRAWERKLHDAGFAGMHWPAEYGGRGAGVVQQAIFIEEYLLAGGPERINQLGLDLLGPTVMVHGTEEQKRTWLPRIMNAEDVWSQGFSEPDAGSDLAGLKTRAVLDGDHFVVNGQKIWTSYGAYADWIFAMVRTDPDAPRHSGVTFLAIDMRSEGVEARPIVQLDGHAGFAEVFFTDVRVPVSQVIGEVNQGWTVAMTTLGFERDTPAASPARFARAITQLIAIAKERGVERDELICDGIAGLHAGVQAYRAHTLRTLTRQARREPIGSEASMTKLMWSELEQRIYEFGRTVLGPYAEVLSAEAPGKSPQLWNTLYWFGRAATIYAGTSEIQRNIISERVLGLPKG